MKYMYDILNRQSNERCKQSDTMISTRLSTQISKASYFLFSENDSSFLNDIDTVRKEMTFILYSLADES